MSTERDTATPDAPSRSFWDSFLGWFLENRLIVGILMTLLLLFGWVVHPFDAIVEAIPEDSAVGEVLHALPRDRVAVDAIPDIGENQQIVFTSWPGRSPRDVEDQVTYPLTTQLLGLPGVKTVRSSSMFGFSSIYVIFEDGIEFYWSRSRILEKLNALPQGLLPSDASPSLGPDATALGQIYWYTLEGRDPESGEVVGGWSLHELRTLQDWTVRYALQASSGVSEVASIGGHVEEFQVEIDPKKIETYQIPITRIAEAVKSSNQDVGARTMEVNRVEYVIRGVGQIEDLEDLEQIVLEEIDGKPLRLGEVAHVTLGPATRRGALDVGGAESVGGVVVARYGENPVKVLEALQEEIDRVQTSLPVRVLPDGRRSQVTIVPFYDRSQVVSETLQTLSDALIQQILMTVIVVIVLLGRLRSSMTISSMLPLSVLGTFVLMKATGVTANVMSLAGIAIAIGTIVDMGIVMTENIVERYEAATTPAERLTALREGSVEVAPAITTSVLTTVLSFLPVFGLTASEGKLFHPLAYTKTYALLTALVFSLCFLPSVAKMLLPRKHGERSLWRKKVARLFPLKHRKKLEYLKNALIVAALLWLLTEAWMPLGLGVPMWENLLSVSVVSLGLLALFWAFLKVYAPLLRWALEHKVVSMSAPIVLLVFGVTVWLGFDRVFGWLPESVRMSAPVVKVAHDVPGLGEEFMPPFDEGQFLYMPTVMPHASLAQSLEQLQLMDAAIMQIPEVKEAVGKLGRVDSALDPAPISMFETIVTYEPEFRLEPDGTRVRQWRDHIRSTQDIWDEIVKAATQPGLTSAPKLMPIQTRIVMLQSGMRAPMGIKLQGPDLESLAQAGEQLEEALRKVPSIRTETVFAERVVGKPYIEVEISREAIARHGLSIDQVQQTLQIALAGMPLMNVIQGRERKSVVIRYVRDSRSDLDSLERILVPTMEGQSVPLAELATFTYVKGPQVIKSEDTFLTSYVIFGPREGLAELEVIEQVEEFLVAEREAGRLTLPDRVTYDFAGSYQNQVRSAARLRVLVPLALLLIFLVLYMQFRRTSTTVILYASVAVALSGGFLLLWLYQQPWFLDVEIAGHLLRDVLQVRPINLSVAVWVGMIALVGIATDDGVVMATYLDQQFARARDDAPGRLDRAAIRQAVLEAGKRRVRPCLMTTATTILALLPVFTSTGRGSDVMIPMAVPILGGMSVELITLFVVPTLYCAREEWLANRRQEAENH